ncbi:MULTISPECIES: thymidylate synthase [Brevundimonas]|jgi:thymidylate synthase|uniref:Thymidylate synthase/dCMP hydroxymethylase domain-containing protein n=4 Tax=Brevundimonas TaxID=41275 RepID=A0A172Y4X7_9CAUL|nr:MULTISPECIES: thymidylate synthase [Brevundimonas]ANF54269.1 hypothetical protein DA69_05660 [Brevundimonas naejangsanensis]SJM63409.1 Thymidylate synthase [Brevundimonas diminuta 3F5N]
MKSERYRNISYATVGGFEAVLTDGKTVSVRGEATREVLGRGTLIEHPQERFPFLPGRLGDPFALVAECLWVLAGRNDLDWLIHYLPRAAQFSDDGMVWRAGYGPRLRDWQGVDQLAEVFRLLSTDHATRRAVMSLFDPGSDFGTSQDIPCNNWLSWLIRDGRLLLNVAVRSNDAMWGFSGINAFEWSVLQELLANWLGVEPGPTYFLASSFHIYERDRHLERAAAVVDAFPGVTPYDFNVATPRLGVAHDRMDAALAEWFAAEARVRQDPDIWPIDSAPSDPFLLASLRIVRLKWGAEIWTEDRLKNELHACPDDDFTAATYERLARRLPSLLDDIPQPCARAYFARATHRPSLTNGLIQAMDCLHREKNAGYGAAWKRRGERISILPNIARKVDRLGHFRSSGVDLAGETLFDTAIDLVVYALKYELFLAEQVPSLAERIGLQGAARAYSDLDDDFTVALRHAGVTPSPDHEVDRELAAAVDSFEDLWPKVEAEADLEARIAAAGRLRVHAARLVGAIAQSQPQVLSAFIRQWSTRDETPTAA